MGRKATPLSVIDDINAQIRARFNADVISRKQFLTFNEETGVWPGWLRRDPALAAGRGQYRIPGPGYVPPGRSVVDGGDDVQQPAPKATKVAVETQDVAVDLHVQKSKDISPAALTEAQFAKMSVSERLRAIRTQASQLAVVPSKDPAFVKFGEFDTVYRIIESNLFYPVYITGLSGNGKTFNANQACAIAGREYIRVNITPETDEDDLLGGFRLVDGNTVFELGPVVIAMLRGAVLMLDEIDYASPKISCIQSVLEGRSVVLKKLGVTIDPTKGFTVIATSNTKGRGSEDGRFVGTQLLNEAFLERFAITIEQEYPSVTVEKNILQKTFAAMGYEVTAQDKEVFELLAKWADGIRKTFMEDGVDDLISTRRLVHIIGGYGIFDRDIKQAVRLGVNRFDTKTRDAFIDLFDKMMPDPANPVPDSWVAPEPEATVADPDGDMPF